MFKNKNSVIIAYIILAIFAIGLIPSAQSAVSPEGISLIKDTYTPTIDIDNTAVFKINITNFNATTNYTGLTLYDYYDKFLLNYTSAIPPAQINESIGELSWQINISSLSTQIIIINFTSLSFGIATNNATIEDNESIFIVADNSNVNINAAPASGGKVVNYTYLWNDSSSALNFTGISQFSFIGAPYVARGPGCSLDFNQYGSSISGQGCNNEKNPSNPGEKALDLGAVWVTQTENYIAWNIIGPFVTDNNLSICGGTPNSSAGYVIEFDADDNMSTGCDMMSEGCYPGADYQIWYFPDDHNSLFAYYNGSQDSIEGLSGGNCSNNPGEVCYLANASIPVAINVTCGINLSHPEQALIGLVLIVNKTNLPDGLELNFETNSFNISQGIANPIDMLTDNGVDKFIFMAPGMDAGACFMYDNTNQSTCETNDQGFKCIWHQVDSTRGFCDPDFVNFAEGAACFTYNTSAACLNSELGYCEWMDDDFAKEKSTNGLGLCIEQFKPMEFSGDCDSDCFSCFTETQCSNSDANGGSTYGGCKWYNDTFNPVGWCDITGMKFGCGETPFDCFSSSECTTNGWFWNSTWNVCLKDSNTEICFNGIDDNANGEIDCEEYYCKDTAKFCGAGIDTLTGDFQGMTPNQALMMKLVGANPQIIRLADDPASDSLSENTSTELLSFNVVVSNLGIGMGIEMINGSDLKACGSSVSDRKYLYLIDKDADIGTGCNITLDSTLYDGFEYIVKYGDFIDTNSTGNATKQIYACYIDTWIPKDSAVLSVTNDDPMNPNPNQLPMICGSEFVMPGEPDAVAAIVVEKASIGNPKDDMRFMAVVLNGSWSDFSDLRSYDKMEDLYYTPGSMGFEPVDCFKEPTKCGTEFMLLGEGKYMPFEDCFMPADEDLDTLTNCDDPDCFNAPHCQGSGGFNVSADKTAPKVKMAKVDAFDDIAFAMWFTNEPTNATLYFYNNDSSCQQLNATIWDEGMKNNPTDDFKPWHNVPLDDYSLGYNLAPSTGYYYKLVSYDKAGNPSKSACLNFTTLATQKNLSVLFNFDSKGSATDYMGNMSININGEPMNLGNYTDKEDMKDTNITFTNPTAESGKNWSIEFIGADIFQDINLNFSDSFLANDTGDNGNLLGMKNEDWLDAAQNLGVDYVILKIPEEGDILYHCIDNGTSCIDVTDVDGVKKLETGTGYSKWQIPVTLGFTSYSAGDGTVYNLTFENLTSAHVSKVIDTNTTIAMGITNHDNTSRIYNLTVENPLNTNAWLNSSTLLNNINISSDGSIIVNLTVNANISGTYEFSIIATLSSNASIILNSSDDLTITLDAGDPETPPDLLISAFSPANTTYNTNYISFNATLNEAGDWCGYSLDGTSNITMSNDTATSFYAQNSSMSEGTHNVIYSCNDTSGNMASSASTTFTIDTIHPSITYISPTAANNSYINNDNSYVNTSVQDASSTITSFIDWNNSLVGWWRFNNNTGTILKDHSTYANTGTLYNMNTGLDNCTANCSGWTISGKFKNALQFDSVNDYVRVENSASLDITDKLTVEAWASRKSNRTYEVIISKHQSWEIYENAGNQMVAFVNTTSDGYSTFGNVPLDEYHHYLMTYDGTNLISYLDGIQKTSSPLTGNINNTANWISIGAKQTWNNWNGTIDEVRIHNRALSPSEINASYNTGLYRLYNNFTTLADGVHQYTAYTQDIAGNINNTETRTITIDTTNPTVSLNSPQDNAYSSVSGIDFKYTPSDNLALTNCSIWLNSTGTWQINTTDSTPVIGVLNTTTITLADGIYIWNVQCIDNADNTAFNDTNYTITVDTLEPTISSIIDNDGIYSSGKTWTINATVIDTHSPIDTVLIEFDSTNHTMANTVSSNYTITFTDLGAGAHNYVIYANDAAGNLNTTAANTLSISKSSTETYLEFDKTTPQLYTTSITPACSGNITGITYSLYRNTTSITNDTAAILGAGDYAFECNTTGSANYTSSTNTTTFTINKATGTPALTLTPSNTTIYGTSTTATCNRGTTQITPILYRDGLDVTSTENGTSLILAAGTYSYVCNNTATANYTAAADSDNLTIDKSSTAITVYLNSSITSTGLGTGDINITITVNTTGKTIYYYRNSTQMQTATTPLTNISTWSALGDYNISGIFSGDANYTASQTDLTLTIQDATAPTITIISPANTTYNTTTIWFNTTLSEPSSWVAYSLNGAPNQTLENSSGNWNKENTDSMYEGSNNIIFYANDSAGNMNASEMLYFIVDIFEPNVILISPELNYNTSSTSITFSFNVIDNLNTSMSCSLYVNGTVVATNTSTLNATTTTFANMAVSAGLNQNWTVSCYDGVNSNAPANRAFTVDTIAPVFNTPSPINNSRTNTPITLSATDATTGLASIRYSISSSANVTSSTIPLSDLTEGTPITIDVYAADYAGNINHTTYTYTKDTTAPTLSIIIPANDTEVLTNSTTLNYTVGELPETIWYTIDSITYTLDNTTLADSLTINFTDIAGRHTLFLYANDSIGNLRTTTSDIRLNIPYNMTNFTQVMETTTGATVNITANISGTITTNDTVWLNQTLNMTLNTTDTTVILENFNGLDASWAYTFNMNTTNTTVKDKIKGRGTNVTKMIHLKRLDNFIKDSKYNGSVVFTPHNSSVYTDVMYCTDDNADICTRITSCPANKFNGTACYIDSQSKITVYVPHFSSVILGNDTIAPEITLVTPSSAETNGFDIPVNISVTEDTTACNYTLNYSSLTGITMTKKSTTAFTKTITSYLPDGSYNLSITCIDANTNTNTTSTIFSVTDNLKPTLVAISSTKTSTTASITWTTDEKTDAKVYYGTTTALGTYKNNTENSTSHTVALTSLTASTTYYYNTTSCDQQDNCNTTGPYSFTTSASGTVDTGGGSSGGAAPVLPISQECETNTDCASTEICTDNECIDLSCGSCEYIRDHTCTPYACCTDTDCAPDEHCLDHQCEKKNIEEDPKPTDEIYEAKKAIEDAKKAIAQNRHIKDTKEAEAILQDAIKALESKNYALAAELAKKAQSLVDTAPLTGNITLQDDDKISSLLLWIVFILLVVIVVGIYAKKKNLIGTPKDQPSHKIEELEQYLKKVRPIIDKLRSSGRISESTDTRFQQIETRVAVAKEMDKANDSHTDETIKKTVKDLIALKTEIESNSN